MISPIKLDGEEFEDVNDLLVVTSLGLPTLVRKVTAQVVLIYCCSDKE